MLTRAADYWLTVSMPNAFNTTSELARHRTRLAILPVGATEQHSHHLPLATDSLIVEAVAQRVAEKLDAYLLPTLPFSISHMHRGSRGSVWLRNQTLVAVVRDLAVSVRHEGFTQFVILNGHGGNFILTPIVQDLNLDFPDLLSLALDCWDAGVSRKVFGELSPMSHADEFETSVMLYLVKRTVRRKLIRDQTVEPDRELLRYLPFRKFSKLTHTGKPSRATVELGRRAVAAMAEHSARSIKATLAKVARHQK